MRLFQGSPSAFGGLRLRSASARPPSLLNSVYLLQFNLFAPISWPGGAASRCRSEWGPEGRSPFCPEPGTAPAQPPVLWLCRQLPPAHAAVFVYRKFHSLPRQGLSSGVFCTVFIAAAG